MRTLSRATAMTRRFLDAVLIVLILVVVFGVVLAKVVPLTGRQTIIVGGRSMGGRMCSMVAGAADGKAPPAKLRGVVAVSYPLHPPGKPDTLRVEHLPAIEVPCLFVSGDRDPFGTPDELEHWTATIAGPVTHHWIAGGRHDLRGKDAEVVAVVEEWLRGLP